MVCCSSCSLRLWCIAQYSAFKQTRCFEMYSAFKMTKCYRVLSLLAIFSFPLSDIGSDVYTTGTHFEGRIDSYGNPVVDETWGYLSAGIILWAWRTTTVIFLVEMDLHKYIKRITGWNPEGGRRQHKFKTHRVLMMVFPFSALYLNTDWRAGCNGILLASFMAPFYAVWGLFSDDANVKAWQYAFVVEVVACTLAFAYPVFLLVYLTYVIPAILRGDEPLALVLICMIESVYESLPQLCLQSYKYIISCQGLDGFPPGCQPAVYVFGFSIAMSAVSILKGVYVFTQKFNEDLIQRDEGQDGFMTDTSSTQRTSSRSRTTRSDSVAGAANAQGACRGRVRLDMDEKDEEQKTCTAVVAID